MAMGNFAGQSCLVDSCLQIHLSGLLLLPTSNFVEENSFRVLIILLCSIRSYTFIFSNMFQYILLGIRKQPSEAVNLNIIQRMLLLGFSAFSAKAKGCQKSNALPKANHFA